MAPFPKTDILINKYFQLAQEPSVPQPQDPQCYMCYCYISCRSKDDSCPSLFILFLWDFEKRVLLLLFFLV